MKQYYTFHPRLLRTEGGVADEIRPSVPEMENNYLLRHRQAEWAGQVDTRARKDTYVRQCARAGSAEDRPPARHRFVVSSPVYFQHKEWKPLILSRVNE
uniref:Uncharacterized protein n=1 Tax=Heterorhabditis bacteriophora TaxID=37862 RepID=A0A1I7XA64_HETBA